MPTELTPTELREVSALESSVLEQITNKTIEIEDIIRIIEGRVDSIKCRLSGNNGAVCSGPEVSNGCSSLDQVDDRLNISLKRLYGLSDTLSNVYDEYLR